MIIKTKNQVCKAIERSGYPMENEDKEQENYQQIYNKIGKKKEIIEIGKKKLLWIEEVLERKKGEWNFFCSEVYTMSYELRKMEKYTFENILKRIKETYQGLYERQCQRLKLAKEKQKELEAEIENLRQDRDKIGSSIRQEKRELDKLQQELKEYPQAQVILKEQAKQKEMLSERAKELKREIAFTEERIVIIEERKRELMEEAKAYNIVDDDDTIIEDIIKGAFKMICAGGLLTTTDLKNILNHDQLENNIIQKERDLFSLTNQLSTLKSELKEIESKLEE